jgi:phage terminase large subunit-like protein
LVKADDLARKAEKAIALPGAQNAFRRMPGPIDLEELRGRRCFGGLDLSTTTDITALAWVFPPEDEDGLWHVLSRYFVPKENLRRRA